jgi:hypothetical protein
MTLAASLSIVAAIVLLALFAPATKAASALSLSQRREILRSAHLHAPNGKLLRKPACIAGLISTVDRRWASAYLTNTRSCVRRYGGATGEAELLKRKRPGARRWKLVGSIGDNCEHGEGGAPDAVLEDLGCGFFQA